MVLEMKLLKKIVMEADRGLDHVALEDQVEVQVWLPLQRQGLVLWQARNCLTDRDQDLVVVIMKDLDVDIVPKKAVLLIDVIAAVRA
jgi:hypothetical protein